NFPTVLLEAMEAGCAIITTNSDGCAEVVGDAGIATTPGNSEQIRNALALLMTDPLRVKALGERATERVRRFRWPRIASQYEKVFQHALADQPGLALEDTATVYIGDRD